MAGAPLNNKNAVKYSEKDAIKILTEALELSNEIEDGTYSYDFIGEIAREMGTYHKVFSYLAEKYESVNDLYDQLKSNLEANCFSNAKKGKIKEATAIVNLKSNYRWTDRLEQNGNQNVSINWNEEKTYE